MRQESARLPVDISGIKTSEIMSSGVVSRSLVLCAGVAPATDHLMVVSEWGLEQGTHKYQPWQSILPLTSMRIFIRAFKIRSRRLTFFKICGMGIHKD